mmetsp:Transcript_24237/g.63278  ORF Transcript_24237/g.63278 Transcript_24237/m.63278 type:complete len:235 (+) Transcript_24237:354-1058(+)
MPSMSSTRSAVHLPLSSKKARTAAGSATLPSEGTMISCPADTPPVFVSTHRSNSTADLAAVPDSSSNRSNSGRRSKSPGSRPVISRHRSAYKMPFVARSCRRMVALPTPASTTSSGISLDVWSRSLRESRGMVLRAASLSSAACISFSSRVCSTTRRTSAELIPALTDANRAASAPCCRASSPASGRSVTVTRCRLSTRKRLTRDRKGPRPSLTAVLSLPSGASKRTCSKGSRP